MKKLTAIVFSLLLILNCSALSVNATELGKNTRNDPFPKMELSVDSVNWLKSVPKLWTGYYDGNHGPTHVRRKYAFKIESINMQTGSFTGIGFVDRYPDSKHPELQVRCSYNLKGTLDPKTHGISFQGTDFIMYISNFDFVKFDAVISDDFKRIDGLTDAWDGAEVHLNSTESYQDEGLKGGTFDFDENVMDPVLAENCMEYSLLAYKESRLEATGYYVSSEGAGAKPLYDKLKREGFLKDNIKSITSAEIEGDTIDSIHWYFAHRTLSDGTELVYIINRGTYRDEWYGDFNVTSREGTYNSEYNGRHYSFESAANALIADLRKEMEDKNGNPKYSKVKYVVTGHSRGAAVANLVAKDLTDFKSSDSSIKGVYGYTFATPTVISKNDSGNYTNIFNFCLDDDFVTYMPLADYNWQYGRYGTTYYSSAASMYKNVPLFKFLMEYYRQYFNQGSLSYKTTGAYKIADYVLGFCPSVEAFYNNKYYAVESHIPSMLGTYSWQDYFYGFFATLLYGKMLSLPSYMGMAEAYPFDGITRAVLVGGAGYATGNYGVCAYLGTHDPCNYYGWMKCLVEDPSLISTSSDLRLELSGKYPYDENMRLAAPRRAAPSEADEEAAADSDEIQEAPADSDDIQEAPAKKAGSKNLAGINEDADEHDLEAIRNLLTTGDNAGKTGWDPEDASTWEGITWEDGRITSIDIQGYGLEGALDVSGCSELKQIYCSGNLLTELYFDECPLEELSCEGNLLEIDEESEIWANVSRLSEEGGFVYSLFPQGIAEDAAFDSDEAAKLRDFAQTGSNNSVLEWSLDAPGSFAGVTWTRIGDEYHVSDIDLSEMGLTGDADLSGLEYVSNINLSGNELTSIDASGCSRLSNLNVSRNKITHIDYSGCPLYSLVCDYNYISGDEYEALAELADLEVSEGGDIVVGLEPQYISAGSDAFDETDLSNVMALTEGLGMDIDWNHPGDNDYLTWREEGGIYHLAKIDLSSQDISGPLDLTMFEHLEDIDLSGTAVTEVRLPQSVCRLSDMAFADCTDLEDLYICDTWNEMGTDVFRNCSKLTIHCTRNSFANFIADAMDINFDEIIALDYITVKGDGAKTAYTGRDYSLNGSKLIAHYTDGSDREVPDGEYEVRGFDNTILGKQTIWFTYTDGDYTRELEYDITVYGVTESGFVYEYSGSDAVIVGYQGTGTNIVIPEIIDEKPVTRIAGDAFSGNTAIKQVSVPGSVKAIDSYAFNGCTGLTNVTLTDGIESIGDRAFSGCSKLKELIMPDSIDSLGTYIFRNCTSLVHVRLNNTRVNITEGTFYGCTSLTKVDIPDTVEYVRNSAFYGCKSLANISLPAGLKEIEREAFYNCDSLKTISLGPNLTDIGSYAFEDCDGLTSIVIPASVTYIGYGTFYGCSNLVKADIKGNISEIKSDLFNGCSKLTSVTIPDSVRDIYSYAFYGCSSLKKITLPASLEYISYGVFSGSGIENIKYNGSLADWEKVEIYDYENEIITSCRIYCVADKKYANPSVAKATVTGISNKTYTGKAIKQKPVVTLGGKTLTAGTDYTVSYKNNKAVGLATVTITGKGGYVGTLKKTFKINPVKVKITAPKSARKAITVKWKKPSAANLKQITGYEIQYALNSKFTKSKKSVTVKKSASSKKITKLKGGKKYYVRIRSFRKVGGKKYYSGWSAKKAVKAKK